MMYLSNVMRKIVETIHLSVNGTRKVCDVNISPDGKPPPGLRLPYLGIGAGSQTPIIEDNTLKYVTLLNVTGTIRARPYKIGETDEPYLQLVDLMQSAHQSISNNSTLLAYAHSAALADNINITGVFIVSNFNLTARKATAEWFSSEDKAHDQSSRDIGYILSSTIRLPFSHEFLSC